MQSTAREARDIAHGSLATAQSAPTDRPVRCLHVDTELFDAIQKQEEGHIEVGERLDLAFCQFDRFHGAQRQDDGARVASARVRHHFVRLLGQRQGNKVAGDRSGNIAGRSGVDAACAKQILRLVPGGEAEAVAVEPGRLASAPAREYPHVVGQRLDASEAEALVANALADFLGGGREILYRVYVLTAKTAAAIGDVQGAVALRSDDEPHGYPPPIIGSVRVMRVLYQLVQHPVAVLGAHHFVQISETLVDMEVLSVCIDGVVQHVPNLCMEFLGGTRPRPAAVVFGTIG